MTGAVRKSLQPPPGRLVSIQPTIGSGSGAKKSTRMKAKQSSKRINLSLRMFFRVLAIMAIYGLATLDGQGPTVAPTVLMCVCVYVCVCVCVCMCVCFVRVYVCVCVCINSVFLST